MKDTANKDRLEEIRSMLGPHVANEHHLRWLVAEVDRGRAVEDSLHAALRFADVGKLPGDFWQLFETIQNNPRPGGEVTE